MRHLTLPTLRGAVVIAAETVDTIEPLGTFRCRIHLHPTEGEDRVKDGTHNSIEVQVSAEEVRSGISELHDGDTYDPWGLEMVDGEVWEV